MRHKNNILNVFDRDFFFSISERVVGIIRDSFDPDGIPYELKSDATPLTCLDTAVNVLVAEEARRLSAEISIVGEEGSDVTGSDYTLIFDPVDGTQPLSEGLPLATFTISLLQHGVPIRAVIANPFHFNSTPGHGIYYAEAGLGAYHGDKRIYLNSSAAVPSGPPGNGLREKIAVTFWPGAAYSLPTVRTMLIDEGFEVIDLRSIARSHLLVLTNHSRFCAVLFPSNKPHDSCAGALLIQEAGGVATSLFGDKQRYDRPIRGHLFARDAATHAKLLAIVRRAMDETPLETVAPA